jgi:endonuclease I
LYTGPNLFGVSVRNEFPISEQEEIVLRQWNREDPPDTLERTRNELIEVRQRNPNPFVDRPYGVDQWGRFVD